jgi:hypothetical protein
MNEQTQMKTKYIEGDVIIDSPEVWKDMHYRIKGELIFEKGGVLDAENCTIELLCDYARQYLYRWKGGTLITKNCTLGGTKSGGFIQQVAFEIIDGLWECEDTTVQYSYGITFGYGKTLGKLRALRLKPGENPDSIIMVGNSDVELIDSEFNISLTAYADNGGKSFLELPVNEPLTKTFDLNTVLGATYKLRIENTSVPMWFLFISIPENSKPSEIVLGKCPFIIPSIQAVNLKGQLDLPTTWDGINDSEWAKTVPHHTTSKIGPLTFKTLDKNVLIPCWGLYLQGDKTDIRVTPPSVICELMLWAGKAELRGERGKNNIWATATTIDVGNEGQVSNNSGNVPEPHSGARLFIENARVGPVEKGAIIGQVTAKGLGHVEIKDSKLLDIQMITKDRGMIVLDRIIKEGIYKEQVNGQPVICRPVLD